MDDFYYEWKPSWAYHKIDTFAVSKNERDTNEGTCKSMKNALYAQQYGKGPIGLKQCRTAKISSV